MKKFIIVLALLSFSLFIIAQGIKYKGEIKIEVSDLQVSKDNSAQAKQMGIGPFDKLEFEAMAQSGKYKMVYLNDFVVFKKGTYILGDANTRLAYFVFPHTKSYWEMDIDEVGKTLQSFQKSLKIKYLNKDVSVSTLPPKVINALPCTGKRIEISYDIETSILGKKSKSHARQVTDYYSTAAYDVLALFGGHNWHNQGLYIGDPNFDKEIAAKIGFLGFPVQVTTENWNDGKYQGKSILTTNDVQLTALSPSNFVLPSGYKMEEVGISSVIKQIANSETAHKEDSLSQKDEKNEEEKKPESEEDSKKVTEAVTKVGKKILKKVIKKIVK